MKREDFTQMTFEPTPKILDGIELWGIRRKKDQEMTGLSCIVHELEKEDEVW